MIHGAVGMHSSYCRDGRDRGSSYCCPSITRKLWPSAKLASLTGSPTPRPPPSPYRDVGKLNASNVVFIAVLLFCLEADALFAG